MSSRGFSTRGDPLFVVGMNLNFARPRAQIGNAPPQQQERTIKTNINPPQASATVLGEGHGSSGEGHNSFSGVLFPDPLPCPSGGDGTATGVPDRAISSAARRLESESLSMRQTTTASKVYMTETQVVVQRNMNTSTSGSGVGKRVSLVDFRESEEEEMTLTGLGKRKKPPRISQLNSSENGSVITSTTTRTFSSTDDQSQSLRERRRGRGGAPRRPSNTAISTLSRPRRRKTSSVQELIPQRSILQIPRLNLPREWSNAGKRNLKDLQNLPRGRRILCQELGPDNEILSDQLKEIRSADNPLDFQRLIARFRRLELPGPRVRSGDYGTAKDLNLTRNPFLRPLETALKTTPFVTGYETDRQLLGVIQLATQGEEGKAIGRDAGTFTVTESQRNSRKWWPNGMSCDEFQTVQSLLFPQSLLNTSSTNAKNIWSHSHHHRRPESTSGRINLRPDKHHYAQATPGKSRGGGVVAEGRIRGQAQTKIVRTGGVVDGGHDNNKDIPEGELLNEVFQWRVNFLLQRLLRTTPDCPKATPASVSPAQFANSTAAEVKTGTGLEFINRTTLRRKVNATLPIGGGSGGTEVKTSVVVSVHQETEFQ